jgi:hypothetical protein
MFLIAGSQTNILCKYAYDLRPYKISHPRRQCFICYCPLPPQKYTHFFEDLWILVSHQPYNFRCSICHYWLWETEKYRTGVASEDITSILNLVTIGHFNNTTRQHNNNRHPGNKKEDKFMLKKQLTQTNLTNNRKIRRKDVWPSAATDTKLNTAYDTLKLLKSSDSRRHWHGNLLCWNIHTTSASLQVSVFICV